MVHGTMIKLTIPHLPFKKLPRVLLIVLALIFTASSRGSEVIVISDVQAHIEWLKSENWWGQVSSNENPVVPYALITGVPASWAENAKDLPVETKKQLFFHYMTPLILHANAMVTERRERLTQIASAISDDASLSPEDRQWLEKIAALLRIETENTGSAELVDQALLKLDVIPAGLALGQAAYESGYGTSRFAAEGNALFGQWTFGGDGLTPGQQRKELGDHRIAAFDWPFDSVRGYYLNLNSHPAYQTFRDIRAERRSSGSPLSSLDLADGLVSYSERGQEYVDSLKGIISTNNLDTLDNATLAPEPVRFIVGAVSQDEAGEIEMEIEILRESGELDRMIARMNLE